MLGAFSPTSTGQLDDVWDAWDDLVEYLYLFVAPGPKVEGLLDQHSPAVGDYP